MSEIARIGDFATHELLNMAGSEAAYSINDSDNIADRRQQVVRALKTLNDIWEESGGDRRIAAFDAEFRGMLPYGPRKMALITGYIEGVAVGFEPLYYNDTKRGVMARFLIALTIVDVEGRVNVDGVPYQTDGPISFSIDLARSRGPIEEVA